MPNPTPAPEPVPEPPKGYGNITLHKKGEIITHKDYRVFHSDWPGWAVCLTPGHPLEHDYWVCTPVAPHPSLSSQLHNPENVAVEKLPTRGYLKGQKDGTAISNNERARFLLIGELENPPEEVYYFSPIKKEFCERADNHSLDYLATYATFAPLPDWVKQSRGKAMINDPVAQKEQERLEALGKATLPELPLTLDAIKFLKIRDNNPQKFWYKEKGNYAPFSNDEIEFLLTQSLLAHDLRERAEKAERSLEQAYKTLEDCGTRQVDYELKESALTAQVERLREALKGIAHAAGSHSGASKGDIERFANEALSSPAPESSASTSATRHLSILQRISAALATPLGRTQKLHEIYQSMKEFKPDELSAPDSGKVVVDREFYAGILAKMIEYYETGPYVNCFNTLEKCQSELHRLRAAQGGEDYDRGNTDPQQV